MKSSGLIEQVRLYGVKAAEATGQAFGVLGIKPSSVSEDG